MNNKKTLWLLLLAFVVVLGGAALLYQKLGGDYTPDQLTVEATPVPTATPAADASEEAQTAETADEEESQANPAPEFTAYDADGNPAKLSDYLGKPLVLNFWASWCGPCKSEMPEFQAAYEELGDDVQFLMVNATTGRETQADAQALLDQEGYTFPVLFDTDGSAAMTYGIYSLPTTYFIDAEGNLVAGARGAISGETLQKGIDMIYPAP